jgi:uncharacterized protein (DUF1697 family)
MTKYAALLRGIGPTNPNMRSEKLRGVFESLGFENVQSVITSGNILFSSENNDVQQLEKMVEAALPKQLGFNSSCFILSQEDLEKLVEADPFTGLTHQNAGETYLTVTFFKQPPKFEFTFPHQPEGKAFQFVTEVNGALCCVVDLTKGKTPDMMGWLERHYGKDLTTRTWATVNRLFDKMNR